MLILLSTHRTCLVLYTHVYSWEGKILPLQMHLWIHIAFLLSWLVPYIHIFPFQQNLPQNSFQSPGCCSKLQVWRLWKQGIAVPSSRQAPWRQVPCMFLWVALPVHINLDLQHSCYSSPGFFMCQILEFVYSYSSVCSEAEVIVNIFCAFSAFTFSSAGCICLLLGACYEGKGPDTRLAAWHCTNLMILHDLNAKSREPRS